MIAAYGWSERLAGAFAPHARAGHLPGRVVVQQRNGYLVVTDRGEVRAKASGRLHHEAGDDGPPAVGDWVALSLNASKGDATIHAVLPRRTAFVRRAAHSAAEVQVIAGNIDVAFIVASMNADLNARRIERYLAAAWQSGARPVVVLTKADLCEDVAGQTAAVAALAGDCPVVVVSARQGMGLEALLAHVGVGETCVLIGSSGVGKSTLVNAFLGEARMATGEIRSGDDHGRHTTSHRELVRLPGGGLIVDTPGMRELGLIGDDEGLEAAFEDVEALIAACRFSDCGHGGEPGCAVRAALDSGALDAGRWASFLKLGQELAAVEAKSEQSAKDAARRVAKRHRDGKRAGRDQD
ncbi:ribosome small subunit-dependent GTPase A [Caulobacter sp. NIBR1757]|uniref:ribosome small subunit-dependent GTPase A n=1 Tax=Caulobacter sp. NIBR1757 TaxID=3016000 RepID=UPI0022F0028F|nr:ribosome small subunit-dependent GTPase A [Caulobacter sp. NIBR1757]WGM40077.1 Small ribosomal subunit biogenesis GTPase RsgA [Caulobacter sp. NIBR1757]